MSDSNHYHIQVSDRFTARAALQMGANFLTGLIVLFVFLPHIIPAYLIMTVEQLAYVPETRKMLQDRTVKLRNPKLDWSAQIHALGSTSEHLVCDGDGSFVYRSGRKRYTMDIDTWVGSGGCEAKMVDGQIYVARATWTYDWLIHSWTIEAVSPPFVYDPGDQ